VNRNGKEHLEQVYREVGPDVWKAIYAFAGASREVADEAVAEAFAQAARRVDAIRDLRPWIYRAAFRIAAGELQRLRVTSAIGPRPSRTEDDPANHVELKELLRLISRSEREAFVLRELLGLSTRETASIMGTSPVAVRVHIHGARKRLRALYHQED
jgi:RNA polymerase sigma-70 factor, ECF subfamily